MINQTSEDYAEAERMYRHGVLEDISSHTEGRFEEIGNNYKNVEQFVFLMQDPIFVNLAIAMRFWDGWIDARNHEWQYYADIKMQDWPILAKSILNDLEGGKSINDPKIIKRFGVSEEGKLRNLFLYLS